MKIGLELQINGQFVGAKDYQVNEYSPLITTADAILEDFNTSCYDYFVKTFADPQTKQYYDKKKKKFSQSKESLIRKLDASEEHINVWQKWHFRLSDKLTTAEKELSIYRKKYKKFKQLMKKVYLAELENHEKHMGPARLNPKIYRVYEVDYAHERPLGLSYGLDEREALDRYFRYNPDRYYGTFKLEFVRTKLRINDK